MKPFKEFKEQDLHAMTLSKSAVAKTNLKDTSKGGLSNLKKDLEDMRNRLAGKPPGGTSK